jgi:hypothetical protein
VIADATRLGLHLYATEALELAAAHLANDQPEAAATLLGASAAARQHMGLHWRYPYHEEAVTIAAARCELALGHARLAAARERGAGAGSAAAVAMATALLADGEAARRL